MVALGILISLFITIILISINEVLWHKFLFHSKKNRFKTYLTSLWNYDIERHKMHHDLCSKHLKDDVMPIELYKVQKISNVFLVGLSGFLIEIVLLNCIGFLNVTTLISNGLFTIIAYVCWYCFEDHFHMAMHKRNYYEQYIQNTWQDSWFKYCKKMHAIHHRNEQFNLGFVFFPIGDFLLGTYKGKIKH